MDTSAADADKLRVEYLPLADLLPYAKNARTHSEQQVGQIAASIREFGFTNPILVSAGRDIIAGHGRALAAHKLGIELVPCIRLGHLTPTQRKAYVLADNRIALNSGWDVAMLSLELHDLKADDFDLGLMGFDDAELTELLKVAPEAGGGSGTGGGGGMGSLSERFGVPPFSVLDARQGYWQERKREWLALGIDSEVGRGANLLKMMSDTVAMPRKTKGHVKAGMVFGAMECPDGAERTINGTSIFDPVLCELAYRWFSPDGGTVLDPFAGGSVRGVVASRLGRQYVGVDLREEQIAANRAQEHLCREPMPVWHCGDSANLSRIAEGVEADLVFSCPPYADLEVYSDDPRDISNMPYERFLELYRAIIGQAVALLKPDRFAVWVVGEVREKKGGGFYRGFVQDSIAAFEDAGVRFYNEGILVTSVGTLPLRCGKTFSASRKLGKTHQNVLVFCKGDPVKASAACGNPQFGEVEEAAAEAGGEPLSGVSEL